MIFKLNRICCQNMTTQTQTQPQIQPIQVKPLPLGGSGSRTRVGQELEKHNKNLTAQLAQVQTDTKYDPKAPTRPTQAVFVEHFSDITTSYVGLTVAGLLLIIYGIVAKK
jgi:hypothetical protein